MKQIRNFIYEVKFTLLVSVVVLFIFILYLAFIGIPKTQARNYYLLAKRHYIYGDYDKYRLLMKKAIEQFPETYIIEEFNLKREVAL